MARFFRFGRKASPEPQEEQPFKAPELRKVDWLREPHLRKLYGWALVLMIASATTGYDGMLINTSQQIARWREFFPETASNNYLGLLINMLNIGQILSFFLTPFVADNFGRKSAIIAGCLLMIGGATVSALATGYVMFIMGRFVVGFGNSLAQMASPLLLTEICHPQHRGPVTAVYNCLWNLGALFVAWAGWGTSNIQNDWSWRSITLMQALPSVTQLIFVWWIPESPRFLISKGRNAEALDILVKYHGGGNMKDITVHFEFREIRDTIGLEKEVATGWRDFVRTRGNRWRLAILISLGVISQYSGNAMFSNYINSIYDGAGVTNESTKLTISGCKMVLDLLVTVAAALNVDRFGRRPMFLTSLIGMVISCALWTLFGILYENSGSTNTTLGYVQLVFIWLFGVFYGIGFTGLLIGYALEILPFNLRAKGMMIMNITIQAVLAMGNQTNKLAWDNLPQHWNLMLLYTVWDFVELMFVYFFYVETKGHTLEEIASIFDGRHAVAHVNMAQLESEVRAGNYHAETAASGRWYGQAKGRKGHVGTESRESILLSDQRVSQSAQSD